MQIRIQHAVSGDHRGGLVQRLELILDGVEVLPNGIDMFEADRHFARAAFLRVLVDELRNKAERSQQTLLPGLQRFDFSVVGHRWER